MDAKYDAPVQPDVDHTQSMSDTGKCGLLRLAFYSDGRRTVIGEQRCEAPLQAHRALYCEEALPDMAYLYMASSSGGILQGDKHRIEITVGEGASAHITTQGATRIYSMNAGSAAQAINITLEKNSYLEFVPDQIIPYGSSRFYQGTEMTVGAGATLVCSEILVPGRVAMGESFEYDVCYLRVRATRQDGALLFTDAACMEPKKRAHSRFGIMGKDAVVGTIYILTEKNSVERLYEEAVSIISGMGEISGGASIMRDDSGILVRILGCSTEAVKGAVHAIVASVRKERKGAPFTPVRKG